jgi:predicted Zn-dependent protease
VQAYATAIGAEPGSVAAESAYLKRMIELGVPAMAEAQAQDLMLRDPNNGQAWAVAAFVNARRGDTPAALGQIATASKRAPDDLFVQRTAGEVLAWYDTHPNGPKPPASVAREVEPLRQAMGNPAGV